MKKRIIYNCFIATLTATMILFFVSCQYDKTINSELESSTQLQNSNDNTDTQQIEDFSETITDQIREEISCSLIKADGKYYLQISGVENNTFQTDNYEKVSWIEFDDIESFSSTVKNNSYTQKQLEDLSRFPLDNGKIEICDLDNLYYLTMNGDPVQNSSVYWYGDYYEWIIEPDINGFDGGVRFQDSEKYFNEYEFCEWILSDASVLKNESSEDGKEFIYFSSNNDEIIDQKLVKYTLVQDEKRVVIIQLYDVVSSPNDLSDDLVNDESLYHIRMYCYEEDISYEILLFSFPDDVNDDILMSFSMQKYVEPENTVE